MLLTFFRHATAEQHGLSKPDADRALVEKGEKQVLRVAQFCSLHQLLPQRLLTSPLLRAQQTAQLLRGELSGCPAPEVVDWLRLGTPVQTAGRRIESLCREANDVWLVGHEPDISALVAELLGIGQFCLQVKKASLTRLQFDNGTGRWLLLWSLPCALMR